MTHDQAVLLLTEFLSGRLDAGTELEVRRHLEGCPECTSLAETHEILAGRHLAVEDLVDLVLHPERMGDARRRRSQVHVDFCSECGTEARQVRTAELEAGSSLGGGGRSGAGAPLLSMAALAVLGLGMSAYFGLYRVPRLESRIDRLEAVPPRRVELPPASGAVGLAPGPLVRVHTLPTPRRGQERIAAVALDPRQPYQYLAIEPPEVEGTVEITFELMAPHGGVVWSSSLPAADLVRLMADSPEVTLAVPTKAFEAGRCILRLHAGASATEPLLLIPFEARKSIE